MSNRRERPQKIRLQPRMSAAKLAEYMDVPSAHRRERIVHGQKFPSDFITARYRDAYDAIRACLLSDDVVARLEGKARLLDAKHATKPYHAEVNASCAKAVRKFARAFPELPLRGVTMAMTGTQGFGLTIDGVDVSVMPSVLLRRVGRNGVEQRGALLLVMTKSVKLSDRAGEAAAELLRQALEQAGQQDVRPELCMVVDVFARQHHIAPRARKRLMQEIASACREISVRWPAVAA